MEDQEESGILFVFFFLAPVHFYVEIKCAF